MPKSSNILILNPSEYFHGAVDGALQELRVHASEHAKLYLVNLLSYFISYENLYPVSADGQRKDTLTEKLAQALEEESAEAKAARFRQLGDYSLYIAGYFSDSLARKAVDVDYYIGMGGAAYEQVAALHLQRSRAEVFAELAMKFPLFVDVLAQISEETKLKNGDNSQELLRIYDVWSRTGSQRLAKQLSKAGIKLPDDDDKDPSKQ
jgi:hypothetical protein